MVRPALSTYFRTTKLTVEVRCFRFETRLRSSRRSRRVIPTLVLCSQASYPSATQPFLPDASADTRTCRPFLPARSLAWSTTLRRGAISTSSSTCALVESSLTGSAQRGRTTSGSSLSPCPRGRSAHYRELTLPLITLTQGRSALGLRCGIDRQVLARPGDRPSRCVSSPSQPAERIALTPAPSHHADLKPENLIFADKTDGADLLIADFGAFSPLRRFACLPEGPDRYRAFLALGLSRIIQEDQFKLLSTVCGTPGLFFRIWPP